MLLERRRSIISFLHEPNHCPVAVLVKSIKVMVLNLSEVVDVLLVSGGLRDRP